jgi:stearoyl-CoA desaturase (delta-9 desaturase)
MIFNSIANQGSIYHWSRDHRLHHQYSDTIADPHDANRGFWFSHVGWLLVKKNKAVYEAGKTINISDLKKDPLVMFQKKADPFWNLAWCFALPAFLALQWGDTMWNGFLVGGAFRYCFVLNATWAVNSVVHAWGNRPYNPSHLTTENGWVSLFALGEGWHNWHHAFSWDYAAAELGPMSQFNPTKVFIDAMALVGLAWDRKRADTVWQQRKTRWEKSQGRVVLESLEGPPLFKHRVVTFGPEPYGEEDEDGQATSDEKPIEGAGEGKVVEAAKKKIPVNAVGQEARRCCWPGVTEFAVARNLQQ